MPTFQPHPDLVTTPISDDELVLLHLTTHRYYSLNETGRFIWRALADGHAPAQVVDEVLKEWDATRAEVEVYVTDLIDELTDEDLLVRAPTASTGS
jgi:hypothetical protein